MRVQLSIAAAAFLLAFASSVLAAAPRDTHDRSPKLPKCRQLGHGWRVDAPSSESS